MESSQQVSYWWLPGRDDEKVPGVYEVSELGESSLTLFELPPGVHADPRDLIGTQVPALRGDLPGGDDLAVRSTVTSFSSLGTVPGKVRLQPQLCLKGRFPVEEPGEITEAVLCFREQDVWTGLPGYEWVAAPRDGEQAVSFVPSPVPVLEIGAGVLRVEGRGTASTSAGEIRFTSRSQFRVTLPGAWDLARLTAEWIDPLEALLTAAMGRPAPLVQGRVTNSGWPDNPRPDVHGARPWLELRPGSLPPLPRRAANVSDVLFTLGDVDWASAGARALDTPTEWSYPVQHWMALLDEDNQWPLARFVGAVQAVESLDRLVNGDGTRTGTDTLDLAARVDAALKAAQFNRNERRKVGRFAHARRERTLEERLRGLDARFADCMRLLTDDAEYAKGIADARNALVHGTADARRLTTDWRPTQAGTELLLHLIEAALLERVGITGTKAAELLVRRRHFDWRRDVVRRGIGHLGVPGSA